MHVILLMLLCSIYLIFSEPQDAKKLKEDKMMKRNRKKEDYKYYEDYKDDEKKIELSFEDLFDNFKIGRLSRCYLPKFMLKIIVSVILIVSIESQFDPTTRMALFTFTQIMWSLYTWCIRPADNKKENFILCCNDIFFSSI
jgi:hypothetical protein